MRAKREAGFSLIEIMVVIFIIGLSLSMASLTMNRGGPQDDLVNSVEEFMVLAHFAGEKAILSGESMALLLEPPEWQLVRGESRDIDDIGWRYQWLTNGSEGWQKLPNLPTVSLPPTIEIEVEVDETRWDYEEQIDRTRPVMALYPTGDLTFIAFELTDSRDRDLVQHIEVDENGELVWLEAPEPPEADDDAF